VQRLFGHVAQRRLMTFPAKRANRQIVIDAFDAAIVHGAVARDGGAAERDALRRQRLHDATAVRLRAIARRRYFALQLGAHLAREQRDRSQPEQVRRISLVCSDDAFAVAAQERILCLRARPVGPALRMAAEAAERIRASSGAEMDAPKSRREVDRSAIRAAGAPAVFGAEQIREELVVFDLVGAGEVLGDVLEAPAFFGLLGSAFPWLRSAIWPPTSGC